MSWLLRLSPEAARRFGDLTWAIAVRADELKSTIDETEHQEWSDGDAGDRHYMSTLHFCSVMLDIAERYAAANKVRRQMLKHDKRDAFGCRYYVVAHALMEGDLLEVARWLKWVRREDQTRDFWCWVEVLYSRLKGLSDGVDAFWQAVETEPMVPIYIAVGPSTPDQFTDVTLVCGSLQQQEYHAAILHRAFAAHPDDFDWLCVLAEQLRVQIRNYAPNLDPRGPAITH